MKNASALLSLILLLILVGLSYWSIYLLRPLQARPVTAPPTEFSAERAMQYIRQIAREPHAMGTPGHARVRAYLLTALRDLGLQPQVQEATVSMPLSGPGSFPGSGAMFEVASRVGYVYNIMARISGREPGKAELLMAHYDSQPNTLGAGDDGAGVAAILETVRALRQGGALRHDVILLFTDGEETGLFGARAFLRHPWARDVGFVINLEARGNSGPNLLFEMSDQNGWIVEQLAQAVPDVVASSLMYEVYKELPNDTDFTIFRRAGYAGVNAAFGEGFVHYHKLTDSPENLNRASLQHQGENLLALARHFGNAPLDQTQAPNKMFFNSVGKGFVQYPMRLNGLWMALLMVALLAAVVVGYRWHKSTIWQVSGGLIFSVLILLLTGIFCWVVNLGITSALPQWHFINGTYSAAIFFVAFVLLTVGVFSLLSRLVLRWLQPVPFVLGACGFVSVLTLALFIFLPAGMYLFVFPLLGELTGLLTVLWLTRRNGSWQPAHALILLIASLPTLFILVPTTHLMFVMFDLQLPVASVLLLGLTLLTLLPLWLWIERGLRWRSIPVLPVTALLLGGAVALWAIRNETPSADKPAHAMLSYFMNAETKRAFWAAYGFQESNDWSRQFFTHPTSGKLTEVYPNGHINVWNSYLKQPANAIDALPPVATIRSDVTTGSVRRLTLDLHSPRGAANLEAGLFPGPQGDIRSVWINGESLPIQAEQTPDGPAFDMVFFGLPVSKTVSLTMEMGTGSPLQLRLYDQSIGLPAELIKAPRPPHVIPEQGRRNNLTVIGTTYTF